MRSIGTVSSSFSVLLGTSLITVALSGVAATKTDSQPLPSSPIFYDSVLYGGWIAPGSDPPSSNNSRSNHSIPSDPFSSDSPSSNSLSSNPSSSDLNPTPSFSREIVFEQTPSTPASLEPDSFTGAIITAIQVQFLDNEGQPTTGYTQPYIITRQFGLQPGDPYDETLAQAGLEQIADLDSIKSAELSLQPTDVPGQVVMVVNVVERNSFQASLDATAPSPSALQGPFQPRSVAVGPDEVTGIALGGVVGFYNLGGNDQDLLLRLRGGENILNGEVSFTDPWIGTASSRTGYAVNLFNQRSIQGVFVGGDEDVDLPGGDDTPWVHRLGGGVQVFRAFTPDLTGAFGVSYQQVSVTDGMFSSEREPVDQQGNALTVSDSGEDDLLILRLATNFDRRNDDTLPTQGDRLLLGIDQSIPIGDAQIAYTQLTGNYTAYFPVDFIGFAPGDRTLAFTVQAGTMLGDVPPYQAFNLDAGPIIRYGGLEIGTGSSFALVGAEYRFPIVNFTIFEQGINLGGSIFGGYVSDLGTASEVIGQPAIVRDKPGEGFGYGVGLRANTPLGLVRLELGFSDEGSAVVFTTGDRF